MEWLTLEWWRLAWIPALALGSAFLAGVWKTRTDARGARDARLDSRMDRDADQARQDIAALRTQRDAAEAEAIRWEGIARWWWRKAHDLAHAIISARWGARTVLERHGEPVPDTWGAAVELPPLEQPTKGD